MRRVTVLLSLCLPLPLLAAFECNPSSQACRQGEGAVECEAGTLPSCLNHCLPTAPAEEASGMPCVTDPCDVERANNGFILCPYEHTCVPEAPGSPVGSCVPRVALQACQEDEPTPCPTGTFCHLFNPEFARPDFIDPGADGMCMPYRREGESCIEWGYLGNVECEPGTTCRPGDPQEPGAVWVCRRSCETVDDCPCPSDTHEPQCEDSPDPGFCSVCVPTGGVCQFEEGAPECCGQAQCETVNSLEQGRCCLPEESSCESDADCCGNAVCHEGSCTPCGTIGEEPTDAGCCGSLEERDDVCSRECRWNGEAAEDGDRCFTGGGNTCEGKVDCRPNGAECVPNDLEPDDDTCNGVDDDCNGVIDEDYEVEDCYTRPPDCQSGFTPTSPGNQICSDGETECVYAANPVSIPYCKKSGMNVFGPSGCLVGQAGGACSEDDECSPGEQCGPETATNCGPGVDGCCNIGSGTMPDWVSCCTVDDDVGDICWNPNDRR